MIVIEAMTQPKEEAGAQRGIEFPIAQNWYHEAQYRADAAGSSRGLWLGIGGLFGLTELDLVVQVVDFDDGLAEQGAV